MIALERTTLGFRFESDLPLAEMKHVLSALKEDEEWAFGDSEWHGDYLGGSLTPEAVVRIYATKRSDLFNASLRLVTRAADENASAKLHQAERRFLDQILPAIQGRNVQQAVPVG